MSVSLSRPPSDFELNYCSNPALILRFFCSGTNMLKVLDESLELTAGAFRRTP
jgi:hypothetical protein